MSLKFKILLYVLISVIFTVSAVVFVLVRSSSHEMYKTAEQEQKTLISFSRDAMKTGLAEGLIDYVKSTLKGMSDTASFNASIVYDEDFTPLLVIPDKYTLPENIEKRLSEALIGKKEEITDDHDDVAGGHELGEKDHISIYNDRIAIDDDAMLYNISSLKDNDGETLGFLMVSFDNQYISKKANDSIKHAVGIVIAVIIPMMFIIGWLISRIISPIITMTHSMEKLSDGDTDIEIIGTARKDEVGMMAHAMEKFKTGLIEKKQMEAKQAQEKIRSEEEKKQSMLDLADRFEGRVQGVIDKVTSSAHELSSISVSLGGNVKNVDRKAESAAISSKETAQNVNTVASASEEMTASVKEISAQMSKTTEVVNEAVSKAEDASVSAKSLEDAAKEVSGVTEFIKDIAEQTNLLALNATIEAARAGEAGKGFSVVASEVKNLASQTTKATEEISKQMESMQNISTEVVGALNAISQTVDNVNQYSSGIASAVEEQSATTNEIASNMQIAAKGVQEIDESVSDIKASSSEAEKSSEQLSSASDLLSKEADNLNSEVASFLAEVREDNTNP